MKRVNKSLVLSDEQKRFIKEYLSNGKNCVQAYAKTRNEPIAEIKKNTRQDAYKYKKHPAVQQALAVAEHNAQRQISRAMDRYAITQERIAQELAKIAFSDTRDIMEWGEDGVRIKPSSELTDEAAGAIAEVSETRNDKTGTTVRVKNHDKVSALVNLGKSMGMFNEKIDHQHKHVSVNFVIEK